MQCDGQQKRSPASIAVERMQCDHKSRIRPEQWSECNAITNLGFGQANGSYQRQYFSLSAEERSSLPDLLDVLKSLDSRCASCDLFVGK
jgi:hypothetical protein